MIKFGGQKFDPPKIVTYPSYGFRAPSGEWRVNISGLAYQTPPLNRRQKMLVKMLARVMKLNEDEIQSANFQNRIWPFFVEADKGHRIQVKIGNRIFGLKKKTRRNGQFGGWIRLADTFCRDCLETNEDGRSTLNYTLLIDHPHSQPIECSVDLLPSKGLSVISDIDDTVKESIVTDRRELLLNTFLRDFRTVDGMADLYQSWHSAGAVFHYVSSSPWQLFRPLQEMQAEFGLPAGTMHLRNFRLRDQFLKKLLVVRRKGKATEIKRLVKNMPLRKFILVGDSGEKDPEIYQKICRRYPDQIQGLFIRNVKDRPLHGERMSKIRRAVGGSCFGVFSDAKDLEREAAGLLERFAMTPSLLNQSG